MMKLIVASLLVSAAAAFAPASPKSTTTSLSAALESELGAQPPLGFFDPLGLCKDGDQGKAAQCSGRTMHDPVFVLFSNNKLTPKNLVLLKIATKQFLQ